MPVAVDDAEVVVLVSFCCYEKSLIESFLNSFVLVSFCCYTYNGQSASYACCFSFFLLLLWLADQIYNILKVLVSFCCYWITPWGLKNAM